MGFTIVPLGFKTINKPIRILFDTTTYIQQDFRWEAREQDHKYHSVIVHQIQ